MSYRGEVLGAYRFFGTLFNIYLRVYHRMEVINREAVPAEGGCIITANHASYLDPPVIGSALLGRRMVRFIPRDTLYDNTWLAAFMNRVGTLPISRDRGDIGALKKIIQAVRDGAAVGIFPEGTRTLDGRMQTPKAGIGFILKKASAPVIPAYIRGTFRALPKKSVFPRPVRVQVRFGDPVLPDSLENMVENKKDYQQYADRIMDKTRDIMAQFGD